MTSSLWIVALCLGVARAQTYITLNRGGCETDCDCTQGCCAVTAAPLVETTDAATTAAATTPPTTTSSLRSGTLGLVTKNGTVTEISSTPDPDPLQDQSNKRDICDTSKDVFMMFNTPLPYNAKFTSCEWHVAEQCRSQDGTETPGPNTGVYFSSYKLQLGKSHSGECTNTFVDQVGTPVTVDRPWIDANGDWNTGKYGHLQGKVVYTFDPPYEVAQGNYFAWANIGTGIVMYRHPDAALDTEKRYCLKAAVNQFNTTGIDLTGCDKQKKWARRYYMNCHYEEVA